MKLISLTQNKFAQVDDEDYDFLMQWRWYAIKATKEELNFYAVTTINQGRGKRQKMIQMHRLLMSLTDPKIIVDHKDGDGLNNQRNNLRLCSFSQNSANK